MLEPVDARLLVVVDEAFAISGRGIVVVPEVVLEAASGIEIAVELRRPDGTAARAVASAHVPFFDPPSVPPRRGHVLLFAGLTKAELPPGTEIWLV